MLKFIMIYILICATSFFCAIRFKKRFEVTIGPALMTIVLLLYLGGILQQLYPVMVLIIGIQVGLIIAGIVCLIKNKQHKDLFLSPGFLIFTLCYGILVMLHKDKMLHHFDEFTHWGLAVKSMYHFDQLGMFPNTLIAFKNYPPGVALLQYYFMQFSGFHEGIMITAYSMMVISMLLYPLRNLSWRSVWIGFLAIVILGLAPMLFFQSIYFSILIDPMVGIVFAYSMYWLYENNKFSLWEGCTIGIILSYAVLVKSSNLLSLCFVILFGILVWYGEQKRTGKKNYYFLGGMIGLPFLIQASFSLITYILKINDAFKVNEISFTKIIQSFLGRGEEHHTITIKNFIGAFFNQPVITYPIDLTPWTLMGVLILIGIGCIYTIKIKEEQKRFVSLISVMTGYFLFYLFGLLLLYLYSFTSYEASVLASYSRYMNVVIMSIYLLLLFILTNHMLEQEHYKGMSIILALIIIVTPFRDLINGTNMNKRYEINRWADYIRDNTALEDRVFFIGQDTFGFEYFAMKYEMTPQVVDCLIWYNLGTKEEATAYKKEATVESFSNALLEGGFKYVFFYRVNENFYTQFKEMFRGVDDYRHLDKKLYQVKEEMGKVLLIQHEENVKE